MDYSISRTKEFIADGTRYFRLRARRGDWADGLRFLADGTVVLSATVAPRDGAMVPAYTTLAATDRHLGPWDHLRTVGEGNLAIAFHGSIVEIRADGSRV